jgi:CheY-like chemotaxis protein
MSLAGKLSDLPLQVFLQILSVSKRTGILTVETEEGKSILVLKNGHVIHVSCPPSIQSSLGQRLLQKRMLSPDRLEQLLEKQRSRGNEPLGSILLEEGILERQTLNHLIKTQIEEAIEKLANINEGSFSFAPDEVVPHDEIYFDPLAPMAEPAIEVQETPNFEPHWNFVTPSKLDELVTFDQIHHIVQAESQTIQELELPADPAPMEVPFHEIAQQIKLPAVEPSSSVLSEVSAQPVKPHITVLLVDDEAFLREVMAKQLRNQGADVHTAESATEAVHIAQKLVEVEEPFCVITDLVMPTISGEAYLGGLEIVEAIRRMTSSAPILVISDFQDPKAQTRAFSLGVFAFKQKPVLSRTSIPEAEGQLCQFTDQLLAAMNQQQTDRDAEGQPNQFWKESGLDQMQPDISASASRMVSEIADLHRKFETLQSSEAPPEISDLILRYASEFFDRAILFQMRSDSAVAVAGFGETGDAQTMEQKIEQMIFPLNSDSIFSRVQSQQKTHTGKLADTPVNRQMIRSTGRLIPRAIALVPLMAGRQIIGAVYGDNAVSKKPFRSLEVLEILLVQIGMAIETALQQHKIMNTNFR